LGRKGDMEGGKGMNKPRCMFCVEFIPQA